VTAPPGRYLYRSTGPVQLYLGDAADVLATLSDSTVDCVVTSPPYWGHRDYATGSWHGGDPACVHPPRQGPATVVCPACGAVFTDPQYGLEATVEEYVDRLVAVFDQLRRVLTPRGTCWLNLGDSYSAGTRTDCDTGSGLTAGRGLPHQPRPNFLPAKQLVGVPWRVAFALQSTGWWLRQDVIWHKPNAMPESVTDRPFANYEHLFLLTTSPRYFFDLDPIRIPLTHPDAADGTRVFGGANKAGHGATGASARRRGSTYRTPKYVADPADQAGRGSHGNLVANGAAHTATHPRGRNPGSVWSMPTRPNRLAHFAAFPVDLPLAAIAAGCPPGAVVCDPFSGIATTGLAALQSGRRYLGIDINPTYHDLALQRLQPLLHTFPSNGEQP
jgi:DNA modification methylase